MSLRERTYLPELVRGLGITARAFVRNFFGKRDPNLDLLERKGVNRVATIAYPEERPVYPAGYRGLHRLVPREDGRPRCVACYLCAAACPSQCIRIEAGEYPQDAPEAASRVVERYPVKFVVDELRCVVCGLCVEACPKDALRMDTGRHALAAEARSALVLERDALLAGPAVSHPSDPWLARESSHAPEPRAAEPSAPSEAESAAVCAPERR